jgi:hypothetical protein
MTRYLLILSVLLIGCGADETVQTASPAGIGNTLSSDPAQGPEGPMGPEGPKGDKGDKGDLGTEGTDGTDGADGSIGTNGTDGIDGINGVAGASGVDGSIGTNGTDGVDGTDGTEGTDGTDGTEGTNGTNGADGEDGISSALIWYPDMMNPMTDPESLGDLIAFSLDMDQFVVRNTYGGNTYTIRFMELTAGYLRIAGSVMSQYVYYAADSCSNTPIVQERPKYRSEVFGSETGSSNRCWMTTADRVSYNAQSKWNLATGACEDIPGMGQTVQGWMTTGCPPIASNQIIAGADKAISMFEITE